MTYYVADSMSFAGSGWPLHHNSVRTFKQLYDANLFIIKRHGKEQILNWPAAVTLPHTSANSGNPAKWRKWYILICCGRVCNYSSYRRGQCNGFIIKFFLESSNVLNK